MPLKYRRFATLALLALLVAIAPAARPARAQIPRVVTNTNDSGAGSLRQAMLSAVAGDTITFNISTGTAPWTIQPTSPLPPLDNGGVTIDGGANHRIVIDGSLASTSDGFRIISSNNTIKGLVIIRFPNTIDLGYGGAGIHIAGTTTLLNDLPIVTGNKILGNWIGVASDGTTAAPNADYGVLIDARSSGNTIGGTTAADRNVIAGNGDSASDADVGILVVLSPATVTPINNNKVIGNYIGTRSDGLAVITGGNPSQGIVLGEWAQNNTIGGATAGERNVIAGHNVSAPIELAAINITGTRSTPNTGNVVAGNYIGVGANGTTPIPNHLGILLNGTGNLPGTPPSATTNTMIGGLTPAAGNVIAGNNSTAITVQGSGTANTTIANNLIGLNASGTALGNGNEGVFVRAGATLTTIGPDNVIAATTFDGVRLSTSNNIVKGNYIGTDTTGTLSGTTYSSRQSSVLVDTGTGNRIGGTTAADRNVLAIGNALTAIELVGSSSGTTVQGNYIGVTAAGNALIDNPPPSGSSGILISTASNVIGGAAPGAGNIIGGTDSGIEINGAGANSNQVKGNAIGVGVGGANVHNLEYGIRVLNSATGNQIGGTAAGEGNVMAFNGAYGVYVLSASNNTVAGNTLRNNGNHGILVQGSTGVRISRTATSANAGNGIALSSGNNNLAAPINLLFSLPGGVPTLTGNACANCTIEVFTSPTREDGEGPRYLMTVTANANGAFSANITGCDRFLTATARNAANDTSPFTTPMADAVNGCETPGPAIQLSAGVPASSAVSPHQVAPGASVVYSHLLTNIGTASGNFSISRTTSQGWAAQPSVTSVTLGAGLSRTILITVTVPPGTAPGTTDQTTVTAAVAGQLSQSRTNYTRVPQVFGVNIQPPRTGSVTPGPTPVTIDYTHYITNTGNGPDTITLSTASTAPGASATVLSGNTCILNAGLSCTKTVRVTIPANSTAPFDDTTVTATSSGGPSRQVVDRTIITQTPIPQISAGTTKNAQPPATVLFTHTVKNIGGAAGTFTMSVTPSPSRPGWSFTLSPPTSFSLDPNETKTITLTVGVPAGAAVGDDVTAQVRVVSSSGAPATANDIVHIVLAPKFSFSAAKVSPVNGQPGQLVSFTHFLTNTGNGADSFTIVLTSTAGLTNLSRAPAGQINLAKGQGTQVVVSARIANGTLASPPAQTIGVTAQRISSPLLPIKRIDTVNVLGAAVPQLTTAQPQTTTLPLPATRVFTHTLTNIGNKPGTFTIGTSAPAGWTATPSNPACLTNLAPTGTCQFTIQVAVPAGTFAGAYKVVVTATADGSASVTDTVHVPPDPHLLFAPNHPSGTADPGAVVTYTHALTNTGNITDSFEITLLLSSGWSALAKPAVVANVPPGTTRSVAIVVTAPEGVPAGSTGTVTATARSAFAPFPSQRVVDRTAINAKPGAKLIPNRQTLSANPTQALSDTVTFVHTLRNSGSIPISYTLSAGSPPIGWTASISPTQVGPLAPGASAPVALKLIVPAGTPFGEVTTTTLRVQQLGGPHDDLAVALDTTAVGPQFGALLTPSINRQFALPGATVIYTHTLRNSGAHPDTFVLSTIAPNGWDTRVAPSSIDLARNGSTTITVTVRVPTSALSGTLDIATVHAQSVTDSTADPGTAQEHTTVRQVAGVSLSPPRFRTAIPGQTIVFQHTLVNTGNGVDTFTLAATISGTGVQTWTVTIDPPSVQLIQGDNYPVVQVRVRVPASASRSASGRVVVTATSRSNPAVRARLEDVIRGPEQVSGQSTIYLPIVAR
ncbi:MAG: beta strand repeat-containing protein [Roseiflexaceae bacterium]